MKDYWATVAALFVFVAQARRQFSPRTVAKAPVGEVLAAVDAQGIRKSDAGLTGFTFAEPNRCKAAEPPTLPAIMSRTIPADNARARGVDRTPQSALERHKGIDELLVRELTAKIATIVPASSPEAAEAFLAIPGDSLVRRRIYAVHQMRTARSAELAPRAEVKPLASQEQAERPLTHQQVAPYHHTTPDLDALALAPVIIDSIAKLTPKVRFAPGLIQGQRSREEASRQMSSSLRRTRMHPGSIWRSTSCQTGGQGAT